ncbi:putative hydro-lyase [Tistrella bauzanensis]
MAAGMVHAAAGEVRAEVPASCRAQIRAGAFTGQTAGLAPGFVQGNVIILPDSHAGDFLRFAQANPKPCPLLAVGEPGNPHLPSLGADIDIRTDLPRYRVFRDGIADADDPLEIGDIWRDDLVTFVIGCSFSFEEALIQDGLDVRHVSLGRNVPMYRSTIPLVPAGRFGGGMVVSMRPFKPADAIRAVQVTSRFPAVHGAPVHLTDPAAIGINDLMRADFGDDPVIGPGEIPVFWACGVTPQVAVEAAKPPIAIAHVPGHMLITDLRNARLAVI